jgi:hypothetical protein
MNSILSPIVSKPIGTFVVLCMAAFLEVSGDACFQSGLQQGVGISRTKCFLLGTFTLAMYGLFVNLPKWDFEKLLGVYVALFFVIAQIVAKVRFHQSPTMPILTGGTLIVRGEW